MCLRVRSLRLISEKQKTVYEKYQQARETAFQYLNNKEYIASNQGIADKLHDELYNTDGQPRYWYHDNVKDFIETVEKLEYSQLSISKTANYGTFVAPYDVDVPDGATAYTLTINAEKKKAIPQAILPAAGEERAVIPACKKAD